MKRHTGHKRMSTEFEHMLRESKRPLPKGAATGDGIPPDSIAGLIATGKITRERSCDGKARFRTYTFADTTVRPSLEARYDKKFETYACAFCDGFHVATMRDVAA